MGLLRFGKDYRHFHCRSPPRTPAPHEAAMSTFSSGPTRRCGPKKDPFERWPGKAQAGHLLLQTNDTSLLDNNRRHGDSPFQGYQRPFSGPNDRGVGLQHSSSPPTPHLDFEIHLWTYQPLFGQNHHLCNSCGRGQQVHHAIDAQSAGRCINIRMKHLIRHLLHDVHLLYYG